MKKVMLSLTLLTLFNNVQSYTYSLNRFELKVHRYLDTDIRPDAQVITPSNANIKESKEFIYFDGTLGSIKSQKPSEYVAFTGVEVLVDQYNSDNLQLYFADVKSQIINPIFTIQIVDIYRNTYSFSTKVIKKTPMSLNLNSFKKSIRGQITNTPYNGVPIKSFRVFLKRSENSKFTSNPLRIKFILSKKSFQL